MNLELKDEKKSQKKDESGKDTTTKENPQMPSVHPKLTEIVTMNNWYKTLVDTMAQGVIATDLHNTIIFTNPKLCAWLGYKKGELVGKSALAIVCEEDRDRVLRETDNRLREKHSSQYEVTLRTKLGSKIPALVSATPILDESKNTLGSYAILTDITDQKYVEKEVISKNEELQKLYNNLLELYEQVASIIAETTKFHTEILLFTSKHCVYCAPAEEVLQEVLSSYAGKITYRKVDIDKEPELSDKHDIMSLPTIVLGEEQITGVPDVFRLHSALFSALVPEEKFRRTRQELDNIIINSPIAIYTISTKGIVTGVNPQTELMFEVARKEIEGKNIFEEGYGTTAQKLPEAFVDLCKKALKGEKVTVNRFHFKEIDKNKADPFSIISFKAVPMTNKEGEVTEILVISEDVTTLALQEEELQISYEKMEQLNDKLLQVNKERAKFVEVTTTGLLEPLRNSRSLIDQILSGQLGDLNEEAFGTIEYLRSNLTNVSKSIIDIMDFSTIESQGFTLQCKDEKIKNLLSETLRTIGSIAIDKGFIIEPLVDPELSVWCDRAQIVRVLMNLILNAIKFTERNCNIEVTAKTKKNFIEVAIKDNGIGLAKKDLERIFKQYIKVDSRSPGSGLGLTVVKSIIEAHGGNVWAESEGKNKGSTFFFTLPRTKKIFQKLIKEKEEACL